MCALKTFLQAKQKARDDHKYALALEKAKEMGVAAEWVKRREHLTLGSLLGKGSWGTVHRCRYDQLQYWDGNRNYVAKLIGTDRRDGMNPDEVRERQELLRNEIALWSMLEHPHCVRFRGVIFNVKSGGGCCLLCDYMSGGSLEDRQIMQRESNAPPPSTEVLVAELLQVARGALHLHEKGVVHRDLKSSNVLIATDGRLCLSDFGLARRVCPTGEMTAETGSYRWMAPEVTFHRRYGLPCDVYSFAMLCTEMLNRTVPFAGMDSVHAAGNAARSEGFRPKLPEDAPAAIVALCRACWQHEPADRLTFTQICASLGSYAAPELVSVELEPEAPQLVSPDAATPLESPAVRPRPRRRRSSAPASLRSYMVLGADAGADAGSATARSGVRKGVRPPFMEQLRGQKEVEAREEQGVTVSASGKSSPRGVSPQSTLTLFAVTCEGLSSWTEL